MIIPDKVEDITGRKFGSLTVTSFSRTKDCAGRSRAHWNCVCDCGSEYEARADSLKQGNTKSCGCLHNSDKKGKILGPQIPIGQAAFNGLYASYKSTAKKKGLVFNINKEQFGNLTRQNCYYCGSPPSREFKAHTSYGVYICNGIDRVDSSVGYEIDNLVPCCKRCNQAKNNMTIEEFISWTERVYNHMKFIELITEE